MTGATRLILVGGGLANGLIAWTMQQRRPEVECIIVEAGPALGGNHTWSFHDDDLTKAEHALVQPFVAHHWAGQEVRFPGFIRQFRNGYRSIPSGRFSDLLIQSLGERVRLNTRAASIEADRVTLEGGEVLQADGVIYGGGPAHSPDVAIRYQAFVGHELRFAAPHGLTRPVIMDATTPQQGGYRFTYVLPFTPDRALVEDTAYVDGGALDKADMQARIERYCAAQGWRVAETIRAEEGVLPIALGGDIERFWASHPGAARVGLAGQFFHPTTGYSLADAVRLAGLVAALPDLSGHAIRVAIEARSKALWHERRLFRGLNRMLFMAGKPDERWRVMDRFHKLPEGLISRFYAARLTTADKMRILTGYPPVPFFSGVRAFFSDGRQSAGQEARA